MSGQKENFRGSVEMIVSMIIAGTVGWFVVMAKQDPQVVVFWRCLFGALIMLAVCIARGLFKKITPSKSLFFLLVVGGISLALNWVFLFKSYSLSTITIATITYHIEPFILVTFGAVFFNEKINLDKVLWLITAFVGTMLIITGKHGSESLSQADTYVAGVFYAILAAFFYAIAAAITKKLKHIPAHVIVVFQLFIGALVLLPLASPDSWSKITMDAWILLMIIGFVHTALICLLLYSAIQKISTTLVGALSFIYPIVAAIVDWLAFDNRLSIMQFCGSAAILIAAAGVNLDWRLT